MNDPRAAVAHWPLTKETGRPLLAGFMTLAVAAATWAGLLWVLRRAPNVPPSRTIAVVSFGRDSVDVASVKLRAPALPRAIPSRPVPLKVSPFLRSHPWAGPVGGRYYYPSTCREVLGFEQLRFFTTEREARASGLVPAKGTPCR
ncbi:MAG: hypothetical protein M3Q37_09425 [Gemmatimonadota bacterium]|nr:hypothetical protein [Gemmatimonadota bacterium]